MQRPENFYRLPKAWQRYVGALEANLTDARNKLDEREGVADQYTKNFIDSYGVYPSRPLPEHVRVRFRFGQSSEDYIDVSRNNDLDGGLILRGGHRILIAPNAANTAIVHSSTPFDRHRDEYWKPGKRRDI